MQYSTVCFFVVQMIRRRAVAMYEEALFLCSKPDCVESEVCRFGVPLFSFEGKMRSLSLVALLVLTE